MVVVLEVGPRVSCVCSTTMFPFFSPTSVLAIFRCITIVLSTTLLCNHQCNHHHPSPELFHFLTWNSSHSLKAPRFPSLLPFPGRVCPCSFWWPCLPAVLRVLARTRLSHGRPLWPPSTPASLHTQASSFLLSIFLFLVSIYLLVIQG